MYNPTQLKISKKNNKSKLILNNNCLNRFRYLPFAGLVIKPQGNSPMFLSFFFGVFLKDSAPWAGMRKVAKTEQTRGQARCASFLGPVWFCCQTLRALFAQEKSNLLPAVSTFAAAHRRHNHTKSLATQGPTFIHIRSCSVHTLLQEET